MTPPKLPELGLYRHRLESAIERKGDLWLLISCKRYIDQSYYGGGIDQCEDGFICDVLLQSGAILTEWWCESPERFHERFEKAC